jgi:uncharacterized membrane protein YhaH (DUF805 family)
MTIQTYIMLIIKYIAFLTAVCGFSWLMVCIGTKEHNNYNQLIINRHNITK